MPASGAAYPACSTSTTTNTSIPTSLSITSSAEALLGVIAGGSGTLGGPAVGAALVLLLKNYASAYIERWNMLLGLVFLFIVLVMPAGIVPGFSRLIAATWSAAMTAPSDYALEVADLKKAFGGLTVTQDVSLAVRPGERRLIIGPNGAGKTTLFNQISGDLRPNSGRIRLFSTDITYLPPYRRAHRGLSRTYQIITLFADDTLEHNVSLGLLGLRPSRWQMWRPMASTPISRPKPAARWTQSGFCILPTTRSPISPTERGGASSWRSRSRKSRACCSWTSRSPAFRTRSGRR